MPVTFKPGDRVRRTKTRDNRVPVGTIGTILVDLGYKFRVRWDNRPYSTWRSLPDWMELADATHSRMAHKARTQPLFL